MVQWRTLHSPNAGGLGSIPGQGTRSHMLQLRPSTAKQMFFKKREGTEEGHHIEAEKPLLRNSLNFSNLEFPQRWVLTGRKTLDLEIVESMCVCAKFVQSCPTLCDPMNCSPSGSSVHGDSPGKNTGAGCHALLQVDSIR